MRNFSLQFLDTNGEVIGEELSLGEGLSAAVIPSGAVRVRVRNDPPGNQ